MTFCLGISFCWSCTHCTLCTYTHTHERIRSLSEPFVWRRAHIQISRVYIFDIAHSQHSTLAVKGIFIFVYLFHVNACGWSFSFCSFQPAHPPPPPFPPKIATIDASVHGNATKVLNNAPKVQPQ